MRNEASVTWFFNTWKPQVPGRHRLEVPRHRRSSRVPELAVFTVTALFGVVLLLVGLRGW